MTRISAVLGMLALAGTAAAQAVGIEVKTIELKQLTPVEAVNLLRPYIVNGGGGVFEVSGKLPIVTIRDVASNIPVLERVLAKYDRSPATIRLVFQLIEADTGPRLVPAANSRSIPTDLDAALRSVLRFTSYRIIGQGIATTGENSMVYQKLATADTVGWVYTYDVRAQLGSIRLSEATLQAQSAVRRASTGPVEIDTSATGSVNLSVSLYKQTDVPNQPAQGMIETGLDVPLGHTVVLGTAATNKSGVAIILTVKPELVRPR